MCSWAKSRKHFISFAQQNMLFILKDAITFWNYYLCWFLFTGNFQWNKLNLWVDGIIIKKNYRTTLCFIIQKLITWLRKTFDNNGNTNRIVCIEKKHKLNRITVFHFIWERRRYSMLEIVRQIEIDSERMKKKTMEISIDVNVMKF